MELEPIFVRGDGNPPHAERFARAGYDPARLLGRADETHGQEGRGLMGALLGLMLGVGLLLVWQWLSEPAQRRSGGTLYG